MILDPALAQAEVVLKARGVGAERPPHPPNLAAAEHLLDGEGGLGRPGIEEPEVPIAQGGLAHAGVGGAEVARLRRVQGQLRGVEAMLMEDRECREVLQQLSAVRSAVHSAMLSYMETYISECVLEQMESNSDRGQREKLASELIHMLEKTT